MGVTTGILILLGIMVIAYPVAILYAYNHGLRCGIQAGKGQEPEPMRGPVEMAMGKAQEAKDNMEMQQWAKEQNQRMQEYFYGADKENES